jgi:monovalent cation:proton antiporter-2 (CPA2) family protein
VNLAYLTDIIILLSAAVLIVPISRFIGFGIVPGFLIAGISVGPSALGLIDNATEIAHLSELGVVFLLFVIGIELKPSRLWLMRGQVFGLGALQVVLAGALIFAAAFYVFGIELRAAVLIGPVLAISSTAFVLQLLSEQKLLQSDYGRTSVAILLFQDLAVVPLIALTSLLMVADLSMGEDISLRLFKSLGVLALVVIGGHLLLKPVLQRVARLGSPEVFTAFAVLLVLGTAVLMTKIGLSMAMGAFVAGLLIADSEFRHQVIAEIQPFRGLLIGLFFMSMGMALEVSLFFDQPLTSIGLVLLLMSVKVIALWPLVIMFGHKSRSALAVSLLLAQSGEFALIIFALANGGGLLGEDIFQQLLLIVILSMLATPPFARWAYSLAISSRCQTTETLSSKEMEDPKQVVIIGFGRVGRRVGEILEVRNVQYLAVDMDARVIKREREAGRALFYGDARRPDVLTSLGVGKADLVIVTVDDLHAAKQVVSSLHNAFPNLDILSRGHDLENCMSLQHQGAWLAVSENLEASIALAQAALSKFQLDENENNEALDKFRDNYYTRTTERSALLIQDDE